jgi:antitoxin PrlF
MPTVSQKGQTTIPIEVRDALGIHPGDEIQFEETDTGYVLRKQSDDDQFGKWHGAISTDRSMRERMEELRDRPLSDQPEDTADEDSAEDERNTGPADIVSPTDGSD